MATLGGFSPIFAQYLDGWKGFGGCSGIEKKTFGDEVEIGKGEFRYVSRVGARFSGNMYEESLVKQFYISLGHAGNRSSPVYMLRIASSSE